MTTTAEATIAIIPSVSVLTIRTTFAIVSEESAELGDFEESGWYDEVGQTFEDVQEAIDFLKSKGACHASDSHPCLRTWFSDDGDMDFRTGDIETRSYHLSGFSDAQFLEVFQAIKAW